MHDDDDLADRAKAARERDDPFPTENVTLRDKRHHIRPADLNNPQTEEYNQMSYQCHDAVQANPASTVRRGSIRPARIPNLKPTAATNPRKSQQSFYFSTADDQPQLQEPRKQDRFPRSTNQGQLYTQPQGPYYVRQDLITEEIRSESFSSQSVLYPQRSIVPNAQDRAGARILPTPPTQPYPDDDHDASDDVDFEDAEEDDD